MKGHGSYVACRPQNDELPGAVWGTARGKAAGFEPYTTQVDEGCPRAVLALSGSRRQLVPGCVLRAYGWGVPVPGLLSSSCLQLVPGSVRHDCPLGLASGLQCKRSRDHGARLARHRKSVRLRRGGARALGWLRGANVPDHSRNRPAVWHQSFSSWGKSAPR